MSLTVCLPTLGRPESLREAVTSLLKHSVLDDTRIVIGFNIDDTTRDMAPVEKTIISVEPREDSLGAKYNRCAKAAPADIYMGWADDQTTTTQGWDKILTEAIGYYPDQCGMVYFGTRESSALPVSWAISQKMVEKIGYFCPTYFPCWYHDTWIDEIARMTGRMFYANVDIVFPGGQGKTRGLREVAFWATFFDLTRPLRREIASKILRDPDLIQPNWHRMQLLQTQDAICSQLQQRNANLRDPLQAQQWEQHAGFDNAATPAYERMKAQAQAMLLDMYPQKAAA